MMDVPELFQFRLRANRLHHMQSLLNIFLTKLWSTFHALPSGYMCTLVAKLQLSYKTSPQEKFKASKTYVRQVEATRTKRGGRTLRKDCPAAKDPVFQKITLHHLSFLFFGSFAVPGGVQSSDDTLGF